MLYAIHALDKPLSADLRRAHGAAHGAFLADAENHGVRIVFSGPMVGDDGVQPVGSLIVVEAADRQTAERFHRADPLHAAGAYDRSTITGFIRKRG